MTHKFYIADAWEELPKLAESLSWEFSLIIADPLYNLTPLEKARLDSYFRDIASNGYVVFSPPENPFIEDHTEVTHHLYWIKPLSTKNYKAMQNPSRFVELMQYKEGRDPAVERVWNGAKQHWAMSTNVYRDIVEEPMLHDKGWRKPLSLIKRLVKLYTNPGDTILDPFAGSGVVAEACMQLGRNSISFDINKEYVTEAKERLRIE